VHESKEHDVVRVNADFNFMNFMLHQSNMEIDIRSIENKIEKYVEEFHTNRQEYPKNSPYMNVLVDMLRRKIRNADIAFQIKDLNVRAIKETDESGLKCSKKPLKVKDFIGGGMYGKVYKLNSKQAVKIVNLSSIFTNDKLRENIENEFSISVEAGKIGIGPKIQDHYVCCDNNKNCFIVLCMDLLKGETIDKWMESNPTVEMKKKVESMLKKKIDQLHKANIAHRDIHGGNVFLVKKGKEIVDVFLIDYGSAVRINDTSHRQDDFDDDLRNIQYFFYTREER